MLVAAPGAAISQAAAQPDEPVVASEALKARSAELVTILNNRGSYAAFFAPAFVAQIPEAKFDELNSQIRASVGAATGVKVTPLSPFTADLQVTFERGSAAMRISVAQTPPNQVNGLRVLSVSGGEATVGAIVDSLKSLPGTTSFALAKLGPADPQLTAAHNADQPLAIGSAFKLVILAELVRATNAGERRWTDMVVLDAQPLPGGLYTKLPLGTKVTLEELAGKMISVSDNSATDILLRHLGREKVEAMLPIVGIARPSGMRPFMTTLDAFKLKGIGTGELAARYLALDESGRRKMLAGEIAAQPLTAINPQLFRDGKPVMVDQLEWFASASDLVRLMDWLRRNSEANAVTRTILSFNPGIGPAAENWRYVGYKGGSEPGVINMTMLLQAKDGSWYALAGTWNNPAAAVDEVRFATLLSRAAELSAP
jgi:hypothetical protein